MKTLKNHDGEGKKVYKLKKQKRVHREKYTNSPCCHAEGVYEKKTSTENCCRKKNTQDGPMQRQNRETEKKTQNDPCRDCVGKREKHKAGEKLRKEKHKAGE
jgi:hypothetical protein